jgi:SAM-dependent methyltransferase
LAVLRKLLSQASVQLQWRTAPGRLLLEGTQPDREDDAGGVGFMEVENRLAYDRFRREHSAMLEKRRALERFLAWSQQSFTVPGYNALIDATVQFEVDFLYAAAPESGSRLPNWRERLVCPVTGLNNRLRGTLLAIDHLLAPRRLGSVRVYATEQVTPFYAWLKRVNPTAVGSEFLGADVPLGAFRDGIRNEDVTRLTHGDAAFDLVVTNDVLEHVPSYRDAYSELFRVLAPGGLLVLTVPFDSGRDEHLVRARLKASGEIEHLLPPEYHGDPVNEQGGVLCYQVFGWRLLDELRAAGFRRAGALLYWSLIHGLLGPDQGVFFAVKDVAR